MRENFIFGVVRILKDLNLVLSHMKIGFFGAGRMSQSLAQSLIKQNVVASKDQIIASDIDEVQRKKVNVS
mgnify:CR=1 FL=1